MCVDLSLGFLFCSIDLYFCLCASTILSWELWLCSRAWSQVGWFHFFLKCNYGRNRIDVINRRNGTIIFQFPNCTSHKYECSRKCFGEGNGNLVQYSCLENSMEKEPGGLQSIRSQKVGHNWVTNTHRRGLIGVRLKKKEKPSLTNLNKFHFSKLSQNILSQNILIHTMSLQEKDISCTIFPKGICPCFLMGHTPTN